MSAKDQPRLTSDQIARLTAAASFVQMLHQSGNLSDEERTQLLDLTWEQVVIRRDRGKAGVNLCSSLLTNPETLMSPKSVLEMIAGYRQVMEAQIEALNKLPPTSSPLPPPSSADPGAISTFLDAAVRNQLQGAAQVLRVLNEVETHLRSTTEPSNRRRSPEILEAEVLRPEPRKEL